MIFYQNFNKFLILLFPISLIAGQMYAEAILLIGFIFTITKEYKYIKIDKISFLFLILFLLLSIEIIFIYKNYEFQSLKQLFVFRFIIYGLIISIFFNRDKQLIKNYLYLLLFVFIFLSFDSFYQFKTGENIIGLKNETHYRISSFFGNEYILGSYIGRLTPIFLSLSIFIFKKDAKINYIILICSVLITFISGDRITIIFSLSYLILHLLLNLNLKKFYFFLIILFFAIFSLLNIQSLNERYIGKTLSEIKIQNKFIYLTPYHHNYAQVSINMFKEKPYFGHGVKSFRNKCSENKFKLNTFKEYESCSTHPHNYYFQFLSENGIFNFLILFFIFILCLVNMVKNFIKFWKTKKYLNLAKFYIYLSLFINLFPIIPSGNFYNGWLLCILTLNISIVNLLEKNYN